MKAVYDQVRALLAGKLPGYKGQIKGILKERGLTFLYNAYWDVPMHRLGIYQATPAEIMHQLSQGVYKNAKQTIFKMMECAARAISLNYNVHLSKAEVIISRRLVDLPQFSNGLLSLRKFYNGVFGLSWISAEAHIAMFQQLYFALGYATTEHNLDKPHATDFFGQVSFFFLKCIRSVVIVVCV